MSEGIDIDRNKSYETASGIFNETSADYSGDLANDTGVDMNGEVGDASDSTVKEPIDASDGEDLNEAGDGQLDSVLDSFQEDKWNDLSLEERKQSMTSLADYVANETGNRNPPDIIFRDDMNDGEYGGYDPCTNTLEINENMLEDSSEAADTVAHEMWHAYQRQCTLDSNSEKGHEYQDEFDNYISPEFDFEGYQNQMVEVEARDYAQGFKNRLSAMKGDV